MSTPDLNDASNQIFNAASRSLEPQGVGVQVLIMTSVSVVTVLFFNLLRPRNKIIYEPKVKYHVGSKPPPRITDSLFGWLPPLIHTKEPELVDKIGLDAVTFLRFLRLMRWLFTAIAALTCAILVPINVVYNIKHVDSRTRDILSMLTIRDVSGNIVYAHVAASYAITLLVVGFVFLHWREMVRLRHAWFRSPEYLQSFYARTLAVMHVPKKYQSDEGIRAIFESVKVPYPTTSVHIGRKVGKLPELIEYHNNTVRELEKVLVRYLKGGHIAKKRPTIRIGGFCGCGGVKHDAITFYTAKLKRTEAAIEEYRAEFETHKAENYGFASMAAVPYAHIVANQLHDKHPKGTIINLAPNPKDIIWENMNKSDMELRRKKVMGFIWLALVCFFYTLPLFIISALSNLVMLTQWVGFLRQWRDESGDLFTNVSALLPSALNAFFGFFLPLIMRWLTQYMGALTHSRLDRAVIARYFAFLVISQLVIFTLIGVIFNSVKEIAAQVNQKLSFGDILSNLHTLPGKINRTYIDQTPYWLTVFSLRGFLALFDLAQIINLLWLSFKTRVFGRTPRDVREWTQPQVFQYSIYYSNILFLGAVGLVFAPLAPLVTVFAAVFFWTSSWVYKYQLMFVFISQVETGGRIWNVVINRLLVNVVLMQVLMILTMGLQYGFRSFKWLAAIPPILIVLGFKIYINRTFDKAFRFYHPTQDELHAAKIHSERADHKGNRLEKRFGHPALQADLFTPMLHAKMMPLLREVYKGKLGHQEAKLDEYGGQKVDAQVVEGIKIAAIEQNDLEYDPALYQRDRGELDWDARSMASFNVLGDGASGLQPAKSMYYANSSNAQSNTQLSGYDRYLVQGPYNASSSTHDIEMTRMETDHEPLLSGGRVGQVTTPPSTYRDGAGLREAPTHRPYGSSGVGQAPSYSSLPGPNGEYEPSEYSPTAPYQLPNMGRQSPHLLQEHHQPQRSHTPQQQASYQHQHQHSYSQQQQASYPPRQHGSFGHQHGSSQGSGTNVAGRGAHRGI